MNHIIVGTAGHVDHGKTKLVERLTGINPDRLEEEKRRGMTIELGFVPLTLPNGQQLGLIDVPGHEHFIKNMLAGAAGMDMVMLVVAADEGVMPQTEEHLNIIHLLGIKKGIVVITKSDLVDGEWMDMITQQIKERIASTSLKDVPIIACSALTGEGIDKLLDILSTVTKDVRPRPAGGYYRLPVDRVFTKSGFGTVVTGTLWSGKMHTGDTVQIWPGGKKARIRNLQVYGEPVQEAVAGTRTAVNVASVDKTDVFRGGWLAAPELLQESYGIDTEFYLLPEAKALPQRCRVRIHHGTAEVMGRVNLLDREELLPGASCFCQLILEEPLPALRGDKLIIRSYSPMKVVGGASILDANPPRHKRHRQEVIAQLAVKANGIPEDVLLDTLMKKRTPMNLKAMAQYAQMPIDEIRALVTALEEKQLIFKLDVDAEIYYILPEIVEDLLEKTEKMLEEYHRSYHLRNGMPAAELHSRIFGGFSPKQRNVLLTCWQNQGRVCITGTTVALAGYVPRPTVHEHTWMDSLAAVYAKEKLEPPDWAKAAADFNIGQAEAAELQQYLCNQGILLKCGDYLFATSAVEEGIAALRAQAADGFTPAQARDILSSTRKFIMPLLEYMDSRMITRRDGDKRVFV